MTQPVSEFDVHVDQVEAFELRVSLDNPKWGAIVTDEPPPLGKDGAPNPARLLASAIGTCLTASFLFCAQRQGGLRLHGVTADVHVEIVRNDRKRLRVGKVSVVLHAPLPAGHEALSKCTPAFEDFCTVTQSIRDGIPVEVSVAPAG